jgi:hypothetical protein
MEKEKEKKEENNLEKEQDGKQLYWVLSVMAGIIVLFTASYFFFQSLNTFEYKGLTFTKEKFGNIPLFKHHYVFYPSITGSAISGTKGAVQEVNIFFRIDPRKNKVPVEGEIFFPVGKTAFISFEGQGLTKCEDASIAAANLASLLSQNGVTVKGALTNKTLAEENNIAFATCDSKPYNPVVLIKESNETRVVKTKENCYEVRISNCEVLDSVEKFMVQTIIDARERQKKFMI